MQASRPFLPSLVVMLGLSACDSDLYETYDTDEIDEIDLAELEVEILEVEEDGPPPELEISSSETADTVSCDLGLPSHIYAGWDNIGVVSGTLTGIGSGNYRLGVTMNSNLNLQWWELFVDGFYVGYGQAPSSQSPMFVASNGEPFQFDLTAPAGAYPGWAYPMTISLYSFPGNQLLCSDTLTMTIPTGCIGVGWWYQQPFPTPWDDTANCYVQALPPGATGFMWQGIWYVTPTNGNQCSIGVFDGANCYIGIAPLNRQGFIYNQALYYTK